MGDREDGGVGKYARKRYSGFFQRLVDRREHRILEQLLRRHLGTRVPHVVDIPCGYGRFHRLLKGFGARITSLDANEHMIARIRARTQRSIQDRAACADILEPLPTTADDADVSFCIRLLQHLHDSGKRETALRNLRGHNRPVLVSYYDRACLHAWTKRLVARLRGRPVRIRMIARETFEAEAARAGLRVCERIPLLPFLHAQTFVFLEPVVPTGIAAEQEVAPEPPISASGAP